MAKWNAALPGCSGHLHQSLWQGERNAFHDARARGGMSRVMQQLHRRADGADARADRDVFAHDQQLQALRAGPVGAAGGDVGRGEPHLRGPRHRRSMRGATRVEYRQSAADINPYMAMAASLGCRAVGHRAQARAARGDARRSRHRGPGPALPTTLGAATAAATSASEPARELSRRARSSITTSRTRRWEVRATRTP